MDERTDLNMELSRNIMSALMDDTVDVEEVISKQKDALVSQGFDSDEVNQYVLMRLKPCLVLLLQICIFKLLL